VDAAASDMAEKKVVPHPLVLVLDNVLPLPNPGHMYLRLGPYTFALISHNVFIDKFQKVNSPTKMST